MVMPYGSGGITPTEEVKEKHTPPTDSKVESLKGLIPKGDEPISQISQKKVSIKSEREPELTCKDSHMWVCVSRKAAPQGGYIYAFQIKKEFETSKAVAAKNKELYPAIESSLEDLTDMITQSETGDYPKFLHGLGFAVEGATVYIPDGEALLAGWKDAKKNREIQSDSFIQKVKSFSSSKDEYIDWEKDFLSKLDGMYTKYLNDPDYEYEYLPPARALVEVKWGNKWEKQDIDAYMKWVEQFATDIFGSGSKTMNGRLQNKRDALLLNQFQNNIKKEFTCCSMGFIKDAIQNPIVEKLKKAMELPDLSLTSSEGIATDSEFVEAYLLFDGLLSTNIEFMHDIPIHILPMLLTKYVVVSADEKERLDEMKIQIASCFQKLSTSKTLAPKDKEQLELTLGVAVDIITSGEKIYDFTNSVIDFIWQDTKNTSSPNPNWKIWNERFPEEHLDIAKLKENWKRAMNLSQ